MKTILMYLLRLLLKLMEEKILNSQRRGNVKGQSALSLGKSILWKMKTMELIQVITRNRLPRRGQA